MLARGARERLRGGGRFDLLTKVQEVGRDLAPLLARGVETLELGLNGCDAGDLLGDRRQLGGCHEKQPETARQIGRGFADGSTRGRISLVCKSR